MSSKPLVAISDFFDMSLDVDDISVVRLIERDNGIFGHPARVDIHMDSGKVYSLVLNDNVNVHEVYNNILDRVNAARKGKLEITC